MLIDSHEEGAELGVRDGEGGGGVTGRGLIASRGVCEDGCDEEVDLGIGELASAAFAEDEIDGVKGR